MANLLTQLMQEHSEEDNGPSSAPISFNTDVTDEDIELAHINLDSATYVIYIS